MTVVPLISAKPDANDTGYNPLVEKLRQSETHRLKMCSLNPRSFEDSSLVSGTRVLVQPEWFLPENGIAVSKKGLPPKARTGIESAYRGAVHGVQTQNAHTFLHVSTLTLLTLHTSVR